ncbi:alpha/beta fold hydrolase [Imhoffiella purpurea]|uniref:Alpha/beta hydrolase fold protein n=1 Tax=Imhoffiella purpurea TaxID=1249627 RepID=W9V884_9GAMM|nr:alpha/beta fold hydrolase [Imhoffiella purpurea]EXJ15639.1 Alpha/beta hydrolase fold protein [Imhoffiella purpurea]
MLKTSMAFGLSILLLLTGPTRAGDSTATEAAPGERGCALESAVVQIGDGAIHYDRAGTGPAVFLLHGLFAQKEQWRGVLCRLASAGLTAIAPDLPGYGQSRGFPIGDYDLKRQAELFGRFAEAIETGRFDLAGNSMGGAIAALFTLSHPDRVRRLAFVGPPLGMEPWGPELRHDILQGFNPFIPTTAAEFDRELELLFAHPPSVPDDVRDGLVDDYVARNGHYRQVWDIVSLFDSVLAGDEGNPLPIDRPVLILWGASDAIYPVAGAEPLQARLRHSRLVVLPDTGHLPMLEGTEETVRELESFLLAPDTGEPLSE